MRREVYDYWIRFVDQNEQTGSKRWPVLYDAVSSVGSAVVIIFLIFSFAFRAVGVIGNSMLPTLRDSDWLAVTSINFNIKRNDIVIITQPNDLNEPLVKRVIGLSGDVVDINFETHEVFINGQRLDEPFINSPTAVSSDVEFPLTVPKGHLFVMGDNRNSSLDSRSSIVGFIDERYVLGVAKARLYPFGDFKLK
ncbi:MAG: signal peptidase I [Oscillospiraceae bacterium]|nr:signal peptidase I [Oscillospiraceae bacterium]